jgi:predicted transcriptional regulator
MMTRARDESLVRKRREELGLLLVGLAKLIGRSPAFVSGVEGGYVPKLPAMMLIAEALGTTPIALWPGEVEEVGE